MSRTPPAGALPVGALLHAAQGAMSVTPPELLGEAPDLVVIAAAPGDETLGCGALLHAAGRAGRGVRVICLTTGAAPEAQTRAALHWQETEAALARLTPGARLHWIGVPMGLLPARGRQFDGLVRRIAPLIPETALVLLPWREEPAADHRHAHAIGRAALHEGCGALGCPIWGRFEPVRDVPHGLRLMAAPPTAQAAKRRALTCHQENASERCLTPVSREHFLLHPELYVVG